MSRHVDPGVIGKKNMNIEIKNLWAGNVRADTASSSHNLVVPVDGSLTLPFLDAAPTGGGSALWVDSNGNLHYTPPTESDLVAGYFAALVLPTTSGNVPAAGEGTVSFAGTGPSLQLRNDTTNALVTIGTSAGGGVGIGIGSSGAGTNNISLGGGSGAGTGNIALGVGTEPSGATSNSIFALRRAGWSGDTDESNHVIVGFQSKAGQYGLSSVCMGRTSNNQSASPFVGIGVKTYTTAAALRGTAIGCYSRTIVGADATGIGYYGRGEAANTVAIGNGLFSNQVSANFANCIVVGKSSTVAGIDTIVIGRTAIGSSTKGCVIGASATVAATNCNAIGKGARNTGVGGSANSNSIGYNTQTAQQQLCIGHDSSAAGWLSTIIGNNSAISVSHGAFVGNSITTTGGNNSFVVGMSATAGSGNSWTFGNGVTGAANTAQLGNASITDLKCAVALTVTSDARVKQDFANLPDDTLAVVTELEPKIYSVDSVGIQQHVTRQELESLQMEIDAAETSQETKAQSEQKLASKTQILASLASDGRPHIGLLAQNTWDVFEQHGIDPALVVKRPANDAVDIWGMQYEKLIPFLVKAIQELSAKCVVLQENITAKLGV